MPISLGCLQKAVLHRWAFGVADFYKSLRCCDFLSSLSFLVVHSHFSLKLQFLMFPLCPENPFLFPSSHMSKYYYNRTNLQLLIRSFSLLHPTVTIQVLESRSGKDRSAPTLQTPFILMLQTPFIGTCIFFFSTLFFNDIGTSAHLFL